MTFFPRIITADELAEFDVVSFDVFDTVLTRNVYRPSDVFLRLQHRLNGTFPKELFHPSFDAFHQSRINAEKSARMLLKDREDVTLQDIAHQYGHTHGVNEDTLLALYEAEMAEEQRSVTPIASVVDLIARLRLSGKRIIFISDMYLPKECIRGLLDRVEAYRTGDSIYVSGEAGYTKATGSLFGHVMHDLAITPKQIAHLGDYIWSDFIVPRLKYGIRSFYFIGAKKNRSERSWGEACGCMYCSSLSGASRSARLAADPGMGDGQRRLFQLGCNVVGPIMASFVMWVVQRAMATNLKRLYFLSRDGQIMFDIARQLVQRHGLQIELRYLYLSRTSVFTALADVENGMNLEWLKEDNVILTIRILADRLKICPTRLLNEINNAGLAIADLDSPLGSDEVHTVSSLAASLPALVSLIAESGQAAHMALTHYLEQEGFFDGTAHALVDLGWKGSIQDALLTIFGKRLPQEGLRGFYFGLVRSEEMRNSKQAYLFYPESHGPYYRYRDLFTILTEVFCAAPHGMVRGYSATVRGTIKPELLPVEDGVNEERIPCLRDGVTAFMQVLDIDPNLCEPLHVRMQVLQILKRIFLNPSVEEAGALGDYRFSGDQAGHSVHAVAPPFALKSALQYLAKSSYAERSTISNWFFASWVRSPIMPRIVLLPVLFAVRTLNNLPGPCASWIVGIAALYGRLVEVFKKYFFRGRTVS